MSDVVLCATPGCGVVIGKDGVGARKPRPCSRCAAQARRIALGIAAPKTGVPSG